MGTVLPFTDRPPSHPPALLVAGAGDGFTKYVRALASGLGATRERPVAITVAEPVPEKAHRAVQLGADVGLAVTSYVGLAENAVADGVGGRTPIVAIVDSVVSLRRMLTAPAAEQRPVVASLLLLTDQTLLAIRMVFTPAHDVVARRETSLFLDTLSSYVQRAGREAIFGAGAKMGHKVVEPLLRRWTAEHLATNLPKVLAGLPPTSAPIEATIDGTRTMPLVVSHHPGGFRPPVALATAILTELQIPTRRGEDIAVAELDSAGIRFHFVRTRGTDGKVAIGRGATIDPSSLTATQAALARAVRYEINARNPAAITD